MKSSDPKISIEELRHRYVYDIFTGALRFRIAPANQPNSRVGQEAGYNRQTKYGIYRVLKFSNKAVYAHRLVWFYVTGEWPKGHIDHIDKNTLNNRFDNLRPSTTSQNKSNCLKYENNTSGFKGVTKFISKAGLKWKSQITFQQKVIYLGLYSSKEEAHEAYVHAAQELQGSFADPG